MLNFFKKKDINKGGDGGEIFIAARKIQGNGKILANGGDGDVGGKGGKVTLLSEDHQFTGEISTKGGKSTLRLKWYQEWWGQAVIALIITIFASLIVGYFYKP